MAQFSKAIIFSSGVALFSTFLLQTDVAIASTVHKGWTYTLDAYNDSSGFDITGQSEYEILGSAYQIANGEVTIAISANFAFDGITNTAASGDKVDFSDILLNFTGKSLDEANGELFGIHFIAGNDSGVSELGIYSHVTAKEVASINNGFDNLAHYNNYILSEGVTPTNGEFDYDDPYFNQDTNIVNVIESGDKIGDIQLISNATSLGLDFNYFGASGTELFAIRFAQALLPQQRGIFHLAPECDNDILAGYINTQEVPTPAAILPTLFGLMGSAVRRKRQSENVADET